MVVLIVEDSPLMAKVLEEILGHAGHGCISVNNGKDAITCLEADPTIDLILSDIEMPEMDGLTLLKEVRGRVEWSKIPFIITAGEQDPGLIVKATKLGCDYYIIKPPNEIQVLRKVREAVGEEIPVLLKDSVAMNRYGLTASTYTELIKAFALEVEEIIHMVEDKMECSEFAAGVQLVLQIQESAALLGAERISQHFSSLPKDTQNEEAGKLLSLLPFFLRELKLLRKSLQIRSSPALQT